MKHEVLKGKTIFFYLMILLSSCNKNKNELMLGEWVRKEVLPAKVQTWVGESENSVKSSIIHKSTNPLLVEGAKLVLYSKMKYSVTNNNDTQETGTWERSKDTLVTISSRQLHRYYLIKENNQKELRLLLVNPEKVQTGSSWGILRMTEVRLEK